MAGYKILSRSECKGRNRSDIKSKNGLYRIPPQISEMMKQQFESDFIKNRIGSKNATRSEDGLFDPKGSEPRGRIVLILATMPVLK